MTDPVSADRVRIDAAAFNTSRSGRVELRVRTSRATDLADLFRSLE